MAARLTGSARAELAATLAQRYEAGESIRALAASTGRSYGAVRNTLKRTGVKLRPRGGPRARRQAKADGHTIGGA